MSSRAPRSRRTRALRAALTAAAVLLLAAALAGAVRAGVRTREAPEVRNLTTTGPVPPQSVEPATGARRAVAAPGETVLTVPVYLWRDGCAPTSTGMVVGYWDGHGFPDLVPGDASTDTPAAYQMVASHGTAGAPGHYEDYSLPKDDAGADCPGRQERGAGRRRARRRFGRRLHAHIVERLTVSGTAGAGPTWSGRRSSTTRSSDSAASPPRTPTSTTASPARGRSPSPGCGRRSTPAGRWCCASTATATAGPTTPSPASAIARPAATRSTPAGTPGPGPSAGSASAASPAATSGASAARRPSR